MCSCPYSSPQISWKSTALFFFLNFSSKSHHTRAEIATTGHLLVCLLSWLYELCLGCLSQCYICRHHLWHHHLLSLRYLLNRLHLLLLLLLLLDLLMLCDWSTRCLTIRHLLYSGC